MSEPLSGHVEVDESYIGGKRKGGKRGRGAEGKTIVFGTLERVMNSTRKGLGIGETEIAREPSRL
jgi:transposase-like protein